MANFMSKQDMGELNLRLQNLCLNLRKAQYDLIVLVTNALCNLRRMVYPVVKQINQRTPDEMEIDSTEAEEYGPLKKLIREIEAATAFLMDLDNSFGEKQWIEFFSPLAPPRKKGEVNLYKKIEEQIGNAKTKGFTRQDAVMYVSFHVATQIKYAARHQRDCNDQKFNEDQLWRLFLSRCKSSQIPIEPPENRISMSEEPEKLISTPNRWNRKQRKPVDLRCPIKLPKKESAAPKKEGSQLEDEVSQSWNEGLRLKDEDSQLENATH